ncbi:MAG: UTP--glucose-1-phosphate uridylyltransferase [Candidatus Parcubacteria bacterium]|nr:UTP--glucose-1-phosphate uridylyltransferase [Candidatus Parcubacteria bacterium]
MVTNIKKAVILIAGLGTRFLPLSKVFPKEFFPLVDKPIIQYLLEEALDSGIKEIIFVVKPNGQKEKILDYIQNNQKIEKILKEKKNETLLAELKKVTDIAENFEFSFVVQKEPLGDGNAILMTKKLVGDEPCAVFFCDDVIDSKIPALSQLVQIFKTCQKPIIGLKKISRVKLPHYGVVDSEIITSRLHKVKNIIEKPPFDTAPSDLAIIGRYIITPEVFDYLKKAVPNKKGEIILADILSKMASDAKMIYGYELDGQWLECGDKLRWLKSNLYLGLKHPKFGDELRKFLKETGSI